MGRKKDEKRKEMSLANMQYKESFRPDEPHLCLIHES